MKFSDDWLERVSAGKIKGARIIYKFAAASVTAGDYQVVSASGNYPTPSTPQFLEVVSDSSNDTALGTGARSVRISGIDENWNGISEVVELNGTTAVPTVNSFFRVSRIAVETSGSYATPEVASHDGSITVQEVGGGDPWGTIEIYNNLAIGSSLVGGFTVPKGKTAHIIKSEFGSSDNRELSIAMRVREGSDIVTAPFIPARTIKLYRNRGNSSIIPERGLGQEIHGPADIVLWARSVSGTINLECSMDILILDNI